MGSGAGTEEGDGCCVLVCSIFSLGGIERERRFEGMVGGDENGDDRHGWANLFLSGDVVRLVILTGCL